MDEDVLKGNGGKSKGESKRSGANSPITTSPWWKETKTNSGILQQKYGYAKDKAEQEYKDFIGRYKGK